MPKQASESSGKKEMPGGLDGVFYKRVMVEKQNGGLKEPER